MDCGAFHPEKGLRCRLEGKHTYHLGGYPPEVEIWEDESVIHQGDSTLQEIAAQIRPGSGVVSPYM